MESGRCRMNAALALRLAARLWGFRQRLFRNRDTSRDTYHRCAGGNRLHNDGIGTDLGAGSHRERAEHLGAGTDHHTVFQRRMTLGAGRQVRSAQGHTLINRAVVAHFRGFPDHDAHRMVKENPAANLGFGMDFNPGEKAAHLRDPAGKCRPALNRAPMRKTMNHHRMKSRISKDDFRCAVSGRILFSNGGDEFASFFKHGDLKPSE